MDILSWFALGIIFFTVIAIVYGIVAIHDIPYLIAKSRNHPHQQAIHTAGWVSLLTLHAIWPFLWIWASMYDPEHGYAGRAQSSPGTNPPPPSSDSPESTDLKKRIAELEAELAAHRQHVAPQPTGE